MLDDKNKIQATDPGKMLDLLVSFPKQIPEAREIAKKADLSAIKTKRVKNIVICGMGGSAIGGDLVRSYAIDLLKVPIIIVRDYLLPAFVGEDSLVVASSYSGNTEETLDSFAEAKNRGCQRIAICTGGKLAAIAKEENIPLIIIPGGLPPRAALGYGFSPLLTILEKMGFLPDRTDEIGETIKILEEGVKLFGIEHAWETNPAKILATQMFEKLPLIYSDDWHFNSVAVRFRGQINENSKQLAYSAVLPENNHNELVGWKILGSLSTELVAILLTDSKIHKRVKFRMDFLEKVQKNLGADVVHAQSRGDGILARMFSLIQLGDWASYYLAILNKEDPKPVRIIDDLKSSLANYA